VLDKESQVLEEAIRDYLMWMISSGYSQRIQQIYEHALNHFLHFIKSKEVTWNDIFTSDTVENFLEERCRTHGSAAAIRGLGRYLFHHKRIQKSIKRPCYQLPEIYEDYLRYCEKLRQISSVRIVHIRRVLAAFHDDLEKFTIPLSSLRIEQVDAFLAEFHKPFAPGTCRIYRSHLRGFLSYLYHERKILPRDLAPLVVGAPVFARAKPPRFLRPHEVQQLFDSLELSSAKELRSYAMVQLAYFLGLRPVEISRISLDDISFSKGELTIRDRKSHNPMRLPIPGQTIKAIAAYVVGGRPKSQDRRLFLTLKAPYGPTSSIVAIHSIRACMHKAGLSSSAYWLRHTYAQNLLEAGASLYEMKEMLGHDTIESTRNYLHIHIKLMREVLFDETL